MSGEENLFDGIGNLGDHVMDEEVVELQPEDHTKVPNTQSDVNEPSTEVNPANQEATDDLFDFGLGTHDNPAPAKKTDAAIDDKEKDDKEKIETTENKGSEDTETTSSPSTTVQAYVNLAENLHAKGVLSSLSKEEIAEAFNKEGIDPDEVLLELQQKEIESAKETYINGLSDADKDVYKAKQAGVSTSNVEQINTQLKNYESYTEDYFNDYDNADTAKQFIKADLTNKGIEEDAAESLIDKYEEDGILGSKAFKVKESFVSTLTASKAEMIKRGEEDRQKYLDSINTHKKELKTTINSTKEIIPGIPLTKEMQTQLYDDFTKPVGKDKKTGQFIDVISDTRSKNPDGFDMLLRYYNRIGLFNMADDGAVNPDFSVINNKLQTNQASNLKKVLNTDGFKSTNTGTRKQEIQHSEDFFGGI